MQDNIGRESSKDNDLFFTCSLIDYIARKTKNTRMDVVNTLGKKRIEKIYDLADVYHSDNIDRVSDDFIVESGMKEGQSISATGSPKMILKTAYTIFDFIDEDIWLGMLKSRNDLTHIYDESSARRLVMIL